MDRCAVFVDAGYLLAAGGELCCGTPARRELDCNYEELAALVVRVATAHANLPLLRVYWYDAARNAQADSQQLRVAALPSFKLRLGRLSGGEQKGVDALIIRDLMTLSRERAMAAAYLISGDEDLREGVVAAQDMGVRVILLGVAYIRNQNQAATLVREADEHIVLSKRELSPYFERLFLSPIQPPAVLPYAVSDAQPLIRDPNSGVTASDNIGSPASAPSLPPTPEEVLLIERVADEFTESWARTASDAQLEVILRERPRIPGDIDIQLAQAISSAVARRIIGDAPWVRPMRGRFWKVLNRIYYERTIASSRHGDTTTIGEPTT